MFFSQLKIVFKIFILLSNISNKKSIYSKTSFQEMQQLLPFPPAFSDHILFYISIFLLSFMPSGSSVLRRYCSTGSFHRFPYVYPSQGFFPGLFCKFAEVQCLSGLQSTFFQHGIVILCHFISGFAMSAQIIRTGRADLIRIHMKPYFLSSRKIFSISAICAVKPLL